MAIDTPLESKQQHDHQASQQRTKDAAATGEGSKNATRLLQQNLNFEEPRLINLEQLRTIYIEDRGLFKDIAPKLWEHFRRDLSNYLTTQHRFIGAGFMDRALWNDKKEFGGLFRAGAIQEKGTAPSHVLDRQVKEDVVQGQYLQFIIRGKITDYHALWEKCFELARNFEGVRSVELFGDRPCLEIYLNVPEDGEEQLEGGIITELLVPVSF